MKNYHDKGLLGWLDSGMAPPPPQIVLDKQIGPEQWDTWKLAASTEELGTQTGHFTGTSRGHSNYFFRYNQSYFIQACVPLHFVIVIGNLQFNKTLHSVTCINSQFCVTPIHFNHSTYNWEQIKFHLHDNASLNVQSLQKKIFKTFSKCLPSSTNLETLAEQIMRARPMRMVSKYYPQHRVWNCNFGDCLDNYIRCLSSPFYKVG